MTTELVTDSNDERLTHSIDETPREQAAAYLVLSDEERAKELVRPTRTKYQHKTCEVEHMAITEMSWAIAETWARDYTFYSSTYCCACKKHRPVSEFVWFDGSVLGT
jgi:hypothetical protein